MMDGGFAHGPSAIQCPSSWPISIAKLASSRAPATGPTSRTANGCSLISACAVEPTGVQQRAPVRACKAFELRAPGALHVAFGAEWTAPERAEACTAWLDETWNHLQPYAGGRMYANYMSAEGEPAAKAAYGRNYARLASIKKRYDPDNVFRGNLNIQPS